MHKHFFSLVGESGSQTETLLQSGSRKMSRSELTLEVEDLATRLQKLGLRCIALYADNGIDWIVTDLACQLTDIRITPIPLFFTDTQIKHAISSSGADALITDQRSFTEYFDVVLTPAQDQRATGGAGLFLLDPDRSAFLPEGTQKITFTSGTTGTPKGVCLSTVQQLTVARAIESVIAVDRPIHLCVLPLSTLLENIAGLYAPLLAGGTIVAPPLADLGLTGSSELDIRKLLACIEQHQPNSMILVPEILNALTLAAESGWRPPSSLQFVAVGGARVAGRLLHRARQAGLPAFEGYGLSESGSVVSLNVPGADRVGSVGRPLPHVDVQIEDGEIVVTGTEFLGYANQPHTWGSGPVATGDIGRIDDDGFIFVNGRAKNQLITSFGRNVSPEWVESELIAGPLLQQAIVFGDARPFCVALLYPREVSTSDEEITAWINKTNQRLPDYAHLDDWYRLPEPMASRDGLTTENGRPKRAMIQQKYSSEINRMYEIKLEACSL